MLRHTHNNGAWQCELVRTLAHKDLPSGRKRSSISLEGQGRSLWTITVSAVIEDMSAKRKNDHQQRTWFRADRFFQHEGRWYFHTREGSMEGPFADRFAARERMEAYIKAMNSGMLGIIDEGEADWGLLPLD